MLAGLREKMAKKHETVTSLASITGFTGYTCLAAMGKKKRPLK